MGNGTPKVNKKHSSPKSRMKMQMHDSMKSMQEAFYRKVNPRREQEIMDSRMIQEDQNAIANLSDKVINRQWDPDRYCQSLGRYDERSEV
jgi:hypothetical protein